MRSYLLRKLIDKIPSHVRANSKVSYEIVYIPEFKDGKTYGETRPDIRQIVIKSGLTPIMTARVLIHEIFHMLALENDFDLTEKQVLGLEESVYNFFRLNKLFELISKIL